MSSDSAQFIFDACVRLKDARAVELGKGNLLAEELEDIERHAGLLLTASRCRASVLEKALRHARGIVASEVSSLIGEARDRFIKLAHRHDEYDDQAIRDILKAAQPGSPAGRIWAQIAERETWIAAWDRALQGVDHGQ